MHEQNGWVGYFSIDNTFSLNPAHTLQGGLHFWYVSRQKSDLFTVQAAQRLDLGLKVLLWQKDLQIAVSVADLFRDSSPDVSTYTNPVRQVYNNYRDDRYVTFSLRYRMGNKKVAVKTRALGNQAERKRAEN